MHLTQFMADTNPSSFIESVADLFHVENDHS